MNFITISDKKWKYMLVEDFTTNCHAYIGYWEATSTSDSSIKITASGDTISITKGYKWDGATYAPTFRRVIEATLVHDALLQCWHNGLELDREVIDGIFLNIMECNNFSLSYIYYSAVRIFALLFAKRSNDKSVKIKKTR